MNLKKPWDFITNHLFWRYVESKKEIKRLRDMIDNNEVVVHIGSFKWEGPSQKDKPSNSSSLTKKELKARLLKGFPWYAGFIIWGVEDTNSMEPYIDDNSLVVMEKTTSKVLSKYPLKRGQVVVYPRLVNGQQILIIHRIVQLDNLGEKFYIKGDNNYFADGWINKDLIKYRLVAKGDFQQEEEGD
jgi:hypothetical protein